MRGERRLRVFEIRILRKICSSKKEEVPGDWRRLRNEELHDQYSSPNIIRVIESRRGRWTEHVARIGAREVYTAFWWGELMEKTTWTI